MTDDRRVTPQRSAGRIVFGLFLLTFVLLIIVSSFSLRPGVGTVPLLVGMPTLIAIVWILVMDLFPRSESVTDDEELHGPMAGVRGVLAAAAEEEEDLTPDAGAGRRQLAFTAWTIGFVALAVVTSFYVAVPVALAAILVAIRVNLLATALIVVGTVGSLYALFDLFLGVRL